MVNKTLGYILAGAGLLVFAFSYPGFRAAVNIPIQAGIGDLYITLMGVAMMLGGAFLVYKSSKEKGMKEVPIYEGHGKHRKIVGIQRISK